MGKGKYAAHGGNGNTRQTAHSVRMADALHFHLSSLPMNVASADPRAAFSTLCLDHAAPLLLIDAAAGRIVDASAAAERFYAFAGGLRGQPLAAICGTDAARLIEACAQALAGACTSFVIEHRCADGESCAVEAQALAVGGGLLFAVLREPRASAPPPVAGDAGADAQPMLQAVLDAMPDLVFFKDAHGRYLGCNPAFEAYAGRAAADIVGRREDELFDPATARRHAESDRVVLSVRRAVRHEESITYPDGRRAQLDTVKTPFVDEHGQCAGLIGISRDVTAMKAAEDALRRSQENMERAQAVARTGSWLIDIERGGLEWSAETRRLLGVQSDGPATYAAFLGAIHPDDRERVDAAWREAVAGKAFNIEHRVIVDGQVRWVRERADLHYDDGGRLVAGLGTVQDITEQKLAEEGLKQAAAVFENTADGVLIADAENRIVAVNRAFTAITGYRADEVIGRTPRLLSSGRHDREFYQRMWTAVREHGHWQGEIWNQRKNGEQFPELLTLSVVRDADGRITNYVGVFSDISHMKRTEEQLAHLAHYDALTDLPNRVLLRLRLEHGVERARRSGERLAVLFIDIDRFKNVNDSLGHPVGDELLVEIARRLRARIRAEDTLARLGGDEFVILLDRIHRIEDVATFAHEIIELLNQPFQLPSAPEVFVGASVGISLYPDDTGDATQLVRNADAALYLAKEAGRNVYRFYTSDLTRAAQERLALESALRRALERGEFVLHYQPVIEVTSGRVIGAEALVRWAHPSEGMIPPLRFIPVAEDTGLIAPLGEWVLEAACRQGRAWADAGHPLAMAVNLSSRQFRSADLLARVRAILERTGFPASRLELEITESTVMESGERALDILRDLKALGVRLLIDDFGTGYSSLAYLKRFPVSALKIDRSFVCDIAEDDNDRMIVATIVAMAHQLGLSVVAEGVENGGQFAFLKGLGCDACQGYLVGRPMAAEAFDRQVFQAAERA